MVYASEGSPTISSPNAIFAGAINWRGAAIPLLDVLG